MIEDVVKGLYKKLDIAMHDYHKNNVAVTREVAVVYNMWLLGKVHFPKLYDFFEVDRLNVFMEDAWYKPQKDRINKELMKGN